MNRCPSKRHTIICAITKPLNSSFPSLLELYHTVGRFISPILRRLLSKFVRFMDSVLFSYSPHQDDDAFSYTFDRPHRSADVLDSSDSLFLVSFSWWKEALSSGGIFGEAFEIGSSVLYSATSSLNRAGEQNKEGQVMVGSGGGSEILVHMRREREAAFSGEEGVSGRDRSFALVSEWMFLKALKWHCDVKDVENLLAREESEHDLFSIQISLLFVMETNMLVIKIYQKDNEYGAFSRAINIFCSISGLFQIWDFSGKMNHLFLRDCNLTMESGFPDNEIVLELHMYGLSNVNNDENKSKEGSMVVQSDFSSAYFSSSFPLNGTTDRVNSCSSISLGVGHGSNCSLGLTGLYNLGNTCFMNSAIQCLAHTPKLIDFFLGDFRKDLNNENPLGMNGKLAMAFGDLLRKLWAPCLRPITPNMLKSTVSSFAPQFSGYNQHDSQEFLAFLLDGLHEDLNRVKSKPYVQAGDDAGRSVGDLANEYWENHLSRNDSIIVDLCQGQYRSTLLCPICKKLSITFDPFMYLSMPLPSTTLREMTLTVLSTDGKTLPCPVTITVPSNGTLKDLIEALGTACSLRDDERLLIAEVYHNSIFRILEDPTDEIELIRDEDLLVAYRLPTETDGLPIVEFIHQRDEKSYSFPSLSKFGLPLVARASDISKGSDIRRLFLKLLCPFLTTDEKYSNDSNASEPNPCEYEEMVNAGYDCALNLDDETKNINFCSDFEFHMNDDAFNTKCSKIHMDEPLPRKKPGNKIKILVTWSEKMIKDYDTSMLCLLPEVYKHTFISKRLHDSVSLYDCVDSFLKEEPLGPEDMWYCPSCKDHRQASKKLDLWRLPEILVIHLKRFSYNRLFKNKLETFIDFPVDDFDLSAYIINKSSEISCRYGLYAVSNHYGSMGGGHYTAFSKHGRGGWYEFDDSRVSPVTEDKIKTQAAYVLFYKRI